MVKGDKVKVARGQFRGHLGKVDRVNVKDSTVLVSGIELTKKDGSKRTYPIQASNLVIHELNLDDKMRSLKMKGEK